jgi:hypothetical protein
MGEIIMDWVTPLLTLALGVCLHYFTTLITIRLNNVKESTVRKISNLEKYFHAIGDILLSIANNPKILFEETIPDQYTKLIGLRNSLNMYMPSSILGNLSGICNKIAMIREEYLAQKGEYDSERLKGLCNRISIDINSRYEEFIIDMRRHLYSEKHKNMKFIRMRKRNDYDFNEEIKTESNDHSDNAHKVSSISAFPAIFITLIVLILAIVINTKR